MGRKQQLANFTRQNQELLENSIKRLFVDLYATGEYNLEIGEPQLTPKNVPKGVLEQMLVMQRTNPSNSQSQFVHILPIIDIDSTSQQITSTELKNLFFSTKPTSSVFPIPHSYHDYLSGEFWENEKQCIVHEVYGKKRNTIPLVYTKKHIKLLSSLYSYETMPFLKQTNKKTRVEIARIQSARNTIFSSLYKSSEQLNKIVAGELEEDYLLPDTIQEYRALREVFSTRPITVLDTTTQRTSLKQEDIYYEQPFEAKLQFRGHSDEYLKRKYEAAEYITSVTEKQGRLF